MALELLKFNSATYFVSKIKLLKINVRYICMLQTTIIPTEYLTVWQNAFKSIWTFSGIGDTYGIWNS